MCAFVKRLLSRYACVRCINVCLCCVCVRVCVGCLCVCAVCMFVHTCVCMFRLQGMDTQKDTTSCMQEKAMNDHDLQTDRHKDRQTDGVDTSIHVRCACILTYEETKSIIPIKP